MHGGKMNKKKPSTHFKISCFAWVIYAEHVCTSVDRKSLCRNGMNNSTSDPSTTSHTRSPAHETRDTRRDQYIIIIIFFCILYSFDYYYYYVCWCSMNDSGFTIWLDALWRRRHVENDVPHTYIRFVGSIRISRAVAFELISRDPQRCSRTHIHASDDGGWLAVIFAAVAAVVVLIFFLLSAGWLAGWLSS